MDYRRWPLFAKILAGAVVGCLLGRWLGPWCAALKPMSDLVLQLLVLLATPLIFFSLVHALLTADVRGRLAGRLAWVLLSNSLAAAVIGLAVAGVVAPGRHFHPPVESATAPATTFAPFGEILRMVPADFVNPFGANNLVGVILIGLAASLALRSMRNGDHRKRIAHLTGYLKLGLDLVLRMLHWVFELLPFGVLAVMARVIGTAGFRPLVEMGWFVGSVVLALALLSAFYATRLRLSSRFRTAQFLRGASEALLLAFSTASSASTLPVTFECATEKLNVSEESASLGVLVGGTFNHDGGAQYQAVAALFVAQAVGSPLGVAQIAVVLGMAMFASVFTAGIPQAGLVTMVAVFRAVHLPLEFIPFLLPVDWLLDRCRTTINVAGDLVATCIVDS